MPKYYYKISNKTFRKYLKNVSYSFLVLFIGFGLTLGIVSIVDYNAYHNWMQNWRHETNLNGALKQIALGEPSDPNLVSFNMLIDDIKTRYPFSEQDPITANEIAENEIDTRKDYPTLNNEVGCIIDRNSVDNSCNKHDNISLVYANKIAFALNNSLQSNPDLEQLNKLIPPVEPRPVSSSVIYKDDLVPIFIVITILFAVAASIGCFIADAQRLSWAMPEDGENIGAHPDTLTFSTFVYGMLQIPVYTIHAAYSVLMERARLKKLDKNKLLREQRSLQDHPLKAALLSQYQRLAQIDLLLEKYPQDAELQEAKKKISETVKELELFPERLTLKSAQTLAKDAVLEDELVRQQMETLLAARNDVENL